jgi:hypothetical protein
MAGRSAVELQFAVKLQSSAAAECGDLGRRDRPGALDRVESDETPLALDSFVSTQGAFQAIGVEGLSSHHQGP